MLKIKWKWIWLGFLTFVIIFAMIPLIFVEMTVPKELRTPDKSSVMGRNSRISDLAIIYDYKKEGRRVAVVQSPIVFIDEAREDGINYFLVVSRGYKTDFASLPWVARLFYSPFDEYAEAAIIHDWLYAIGEPGKKREADLTFLRVMLQDGVSPVLARYFYTAVRFNSLFDNGGFGRKSEWENGFYSTILEDDLPPECVIDKPQTAWLKSSDVFNFEQTAQAMSEMMNISTEDMEMTADDFDQGSVFIGAQMKGVDPAFSAWIDALNEEKCKTFVLGPKMQAYSEEQFRNLLATAGEYEEQQVSAAVMTRTRLFTQFIDLEARSLAYRPYLEAIVDAQYGITIPDEFWCLNANDQRVALATSLPWLGPDEPALWPSMSCSSIRNKLPPETANLDPCNSPENREFDFLFGEWEHVNVGETEPSYQLTVAPTQTCSLFAFTPDQDPSWASSIYRDVITGEWRMDWISPYEIMTFKGQAIAPGHMVLTGTLRVPTEQWELPARASFKAVEEAGEPMTIQFLLELVPYGGTDWEPFSNGVLRPRDTASD